MYSYVPMAYDLINSLRTLLIS